MLINIFFTWLLYHILLYTGLLYEYVCAEILVDFGICGLRRSGLAGWKSFRGVETPQRRNWKKLVYYSPRSRRRFLLKLLVIPWISSTLCCSFLFFHLLFSYRSYASFSISLFCVLDFRKGGCATRWQHTAFLNNRKRMNEETFVENGRKNSNARKTSRV